MLGVSVRIGVSGGEAADNGSTDGQKPGPGAAAGLGCPGDCSTSFRTCLRPEPERSDAGDQGPGASLQSRARPGVSHQMEREITLGDTQQRTSGAQAGDDGVSRK